MRWRRDISSYPVMYSIVMNDLLKNRLSCFTSNEILKCFFFSKKKKKKMRKKNQIPALLDNVAR